MPEQAIPDFVWKALMAVVMKLVFPVILVLAIIGALVLAWMWKKGSLPFMPREKKVNEDKNIHSRRQNDEIIERLFEQYREGLDRWIQSQEKIQGAMDGWAHVLRALTGEVQTVSRNQAAMMDNTREDIRGVHERLDTMLSNGSTVKKVA